MRPQHPNRRTALAALAGPSALALGPAGAAAERKPWRVGPGQALERLSDALRAAADGDTIEVLPGTYRGDVAVITQRRLTIRGLGERPVLQADGRSAEGKAILVVRDGEVLIEHLEFRGARVADGNGAGIRFEKGRLTVRRCAFFDNENGLLTANFGDAELRIEDCLFAQAPTDHGLLNHLLYVGRIATLVVTGSRFHQGHVGHLIKSRARTSRIAYNLIVDGPRGQASYEVDLPNGGLAVLVGNVIGQGAGTQNPVLVSFGSEGAAWPGSALYLAHNTLVNERLPSAWFLRVWRDKLPPGTPVHLVNNLSAGPGLFTLGVRDGPLETDGNFPVPRQALEAPDELAYGLTSGSWLHGLGVVPPAPDGIDLRPTAEFALPIGTRPLAAPARWSPGAFQR